MPLPWLRIIDGVLGATDLVRWVKGQPPADTRIAGESRLEARLAGVVVSALKEAFDRDHQRLELERQRLEEERNRAERLLRLEWLRQAGEREIGILDGRDNRRCGIAAAHLFQPRKRVRTVRSDFENHTPGLGDMVMVGRLRGRHGMRGELR